MYLSDSRNTDPVFGDARGFFYHVTRNKGGQEAVFVVSVESTKLPLVLLICTERLAIPITNSKTTALIKCLIMNCVEVGHDKTR